VLLDATAASTPQQVSDITDTLYLRRRKK